MFKSQNIDIPLIGGATTSAELWYIRRVDGPKGDSGNLGFLQYLRSPAGRIRGADSPTSAAGLAYRAMLPIFCCGLSETAIRPAAAIMQPPSRHAIHIEPYFDVIRAKATPDTVDLTSRFSRPQLVSSGADASLDEVYGALDYSADGKEQALSSIIVVDDIFRSGKTVGAVLSRLRDAGVTEECDVQVVAPLWIANT